MKSASVFDVPRTTFVCVDVKWGSLESVGNHTRHRVRFQMSIERE